ncbi:VanZ family protein [Gemella sp. GH3]|uniref:VanZ family protein n=1 Tax=unclassified Gemella TaxID=2624949 RepID=UPI0015CFD3AB|nr:MULTISPECIES: VanZ family protein [unclassified Gemella]MBF0713511.1 VanZ family protein [Gemella sp. GH3.1]NYS50463.1 VanZ family protein [Gemella sp. GH3]
MLKIIFNKHISLLCIIVICSIIIYFSHQTGVESSKISSNILIRKLGHITEYTALSFFTNVFLSNHINKEKSIIYYSFMFVVFFATTDEIHQLLIPGRTFKITDIFIDSIGGIIGILLYLSINKIYIKLPK